MIPDVRLYSVSYRTLAFSFCTMPSKGLEKQCNCSWANRNETQSYWAEIIVVSNSKHSAIISNISHSCGKQEEITKVALILICFYFLKSLLLITNLFIGHLAIIFWQCSFVLNCGWPVKWIEWVTSLFVINVVPLFYIFTVKWDSLYVSYR